MSFVLSVLAQDLRRCTVALIIRCESSGLGVQRIETDLFVKVKRQIGEGGEVLDQAAVLGVRVQSGKGVRPVYFCQPLRPDDVEYAVVELMAEPLYTLIRGLRDGPESRARHQLLHLTPDFRLIRRVAERNRTDAVAHALGAGHQVHIGFAQNQGFQCDVA